MKFATSSLLTILGTHPSARPAVVNEVAARPAVVNEVAAVNKESTERQGQCDWNYARTYMSGKCVRPDKVSRYAFVDDGFWFDDNYVCPGDCCAGPHSGAGSTTEACKCLPKGTKHESAYVDKPYSWHWFCCSLQAARGGTHYINVNSWSGNNETTCGCAEVGNQMFYNDAAESDCCSGKWDSASSKTCIKAECTHKGETGENCCGYRTAQGMFAHTNHDGTCKCIPHGQVLNHWQDQTGSDCCSGALMDGSSNICGCISATDVALTAGATKEDCCTGETETNGNGEFCLAGTCSPPGQSSAGGEHCCSKQSHGDVCECLAGGTDLPDGANPINNCCSGAAENGKCTWLATGAIPNPYSSDKAAQCASGVLDSDGNCACAKPGAELADSSLGGSHCCSATFEGDSKKCSCISNGGSLRPGTLASDCCSRTKASNANACSCAFMGRPAWSAESSGSECCAGYQQEGWCGCKEAGADIQPRGICCGGFENTTDVCLCIPDGTAVETTYTRGSACCSGQITDGKCAGGTTTMAPSALSEKPGKVTKPISQPPKQEVKK